MKNNIIIEHDNLRKFRNKLRKISGKYEKVYRKKQILTIYLFHLYFIKQLKNVGQKLISKGIHENN